MPFQEQKISLISNKETLTLFIRRIHRGAKRDAATCSYACRATRTPPWSTFYLSSPPNVTTCRRKSTPALTLRTSRMTFSTRKLLRDSFSIHIPAYPKLWPNKPLHLRLLAMVNGGAQCSLLWSSAGPFVTRRLAWCSAIIWGVT
jgi:hypothetical protein